MMRVEQTDNIAVASSQDHETELIPRNKLPASITMSRQRRTICRNRGSFQKFASGFAEDCHTGNLGPAADLEGNIDIQIRDHDQTAIGNPAYDLIRLSVSQAMAARSADLPAVTTALIIEAMIESYSATLTGIRRKRR
jgi:hypothetical protein